MTSTATDRILGAASSLAIKAPCLAASTGVLVLSGLQTVDGVVLASGDRVLVKNQASGVDNGIYIADSGTWILAPDADGNADWTKGTLVSVVGGVTNSGFWYMSTAGVIVVGTTAISFAQASIGLASVSAFMQTLLNSADATTAAIAFLAAGISMTGDISPAALAANTDDWAPAGFATASTIRMNATAAYNLTGIAGGADGRLICLHNISAFVVTLKNNTTSAAANQFLLSADYLLTANQSVVLEYDSTSNKWRLFGQQSQQTTTPPNFKNRLINAAWRFDQIKEGGAYAVAAATVQGPDGWSGTATGAGTFTMTKVADPDNASLFALKVACTVADAAIGAADNYIIFTAIEGYDVADLKIGTANAAQGTLSFDMTFPVAGVYGIWLQNSAGDRYYVGTVTQNVANTTESKTLTVSLDQAGVWLYTNGIGLKMGIVLAAGANFQGAAGAWQAGLIETTAAQANFMSLNTNVGYIKRIQLEKGAVATPFEEKSMPDDLIRTQRYYAKSYSQGVTPGTNTNLGALEAGNFAAGAAPSIMVSFPVCMRAPPTVGSYSIVGTPGDMTDAAAADQVAARDFIGDSGFRIYISAGTLTNISGHYTANARLT